MMCFISILTILFNSETSERKQAFTWILHLVEFQLGIIRRPCQRDGIEETVMPNIYENAVAFSLYTQ